MKKKLIALAALAISAAGAGVSNAATVTPMPVTDVAAQQGTSMLAAAVVPPPFVPRPRPRPIPRPVSRF